MTASDEAGLAGHRTVGEVDEPVGSLGDPERRLSCARAGVASTFGGDRLAWVIAVVAAPVYAGYGILRQLNIMTGGYDLGIFDQAMQAYAKFQAPEVPLKGLHYNLLGDHFHPIIALLAPLYWIWSDPRMLLIAQGVLLALSVLPVWRFTRRRLTHGQTTMVVISYALSWPIQGMVDFDFHEIAFAVPLIAFMIDALDRRSYRWMAACAFVLLFVREDMGLMVLMVAIVLLARKKFWWSLGMGAMGVAGYLFATAVVIPHFAQNGKFAYWTYDALGPNAPSALLHMVRHPIDTARIFFTPITKTETMLWLFGSTTMFLSLFSPYVLLTLPILAERMFSSREALWGTEFHYSSILAPIVFMAAVDTLGKLMHRYSIPRRWVSGWAVVVLAVPLVGSIFGHTMYPLGRLVTGEAYQSSARSRSLTAILPLIPSGVCVAADDRAVPQLTHRDYVTNPTIPSPPITWLLLDLSQHETGYLGPEPNAYLKVALRSGFQVVARNGTIVLLHRDLPIDPLCRSYGG
jgi:uncharacterized membrane protein